MADVTAGARWLAQGERDVPASTRWLTPDESARAGVARFRKVRTEYLLRRWTCKCAVAEVLGIDRGDGDLARIEVRSLPTGAPSVHVDGAPSPLDVSLTDRAGWAVCLLGVGLGRVGCDVELVEPRSSGFVGDFLTPREQQGVASVPAGDRDAVANLIWSAKESALKVLQTGLRRDTRSVEVRLADDGLLDVARSDSGWRRLEATTAEGSQLPGWWRRDGSFLLTVVSESSMPSPVRLIASADLGAAAPVHSWVERPLVD